MLRPASVLFVLSVLLTAVAPAPAAARVADPGLQRVIVILADGAAAAESGAGPAGSAAAARPARSARVPAQVRSLRRQVGFRPDRVFRTAVHGFSARLTGAQIAALRASDQVSAVVPDQRLTLADAGRGTDHTASGGVVSTGGDGVQHLSTGLRRIHADDDPIAAIAGDGGRVDADVAVLDSGIADHPDLAIAGGINCTDTGGNAAWGDVLGHGTHVAGIIGALDNGIGVAGVAPGVRLWSVKIIGDDDHGYVSWAVCGLDWVASAKDAAGNARFEAANMSVGGELLYPDTPCGVGTGDVYHQAVCRVVAAGIPVVAAAGNNSGDADDYRPSAYDEAITVSALADFDGLPGGDGVQADICPWYALDRDDTFANFSDHGAAVDLIAPGKCIFSTFTRGRYAWMSGTSMATPHVTGAVILYRQRYPDASPAAIEAALRIAGTFAWGIRTDPDGHPDPLLDVSRFQAPPAFAVDATDPEGYLGAEGTIKADLTITRSNGQTAPIVISGPRLPDGLTVDAATLRGDSGTITLRANGLTTSGPLDVTVRASDGVSVRAVKLHLLVDAEPPAAAFVMPEAAAAGAMITVDPEVALDWTVEDAGGSGLTTVRLEQTTAPIPAPGSCEAADYAAPVTLELVPGTAQAALNRCTRWVLTARDGAGNRTVRRSAPVIVDASAPGQVRVASVSGEGAWAAPGSTQLWVRRDLAGPLSITLDADDAQSGVAGLQPVAEDLGSGWSLAPAATEQTDVLVLDRVAGLADSHLRVGAINGAGLVGEPVTLSLAVDGTAPTAPAWQHPAAGDRPVTADGLTLTWTPGTDAGSGIDPTVLVGRQQAPASAVGDCTGVTYGPLGVLSPAVSGTAASGLTDRTCVRFVARSRDRVGNLSAPATSAPVLVDAAAPQLSVTAPAAGTLVTDTDGSLRLTWSAGDAGGSGLLRTWIQRNAVGITSPGTCPDAGYQPETGRLTATTPLLVSGLAGGRCYRWTLGARDVAGNTAVTTTGTVLVDTTAPQAPAASVRGQGVAWDAATRTAWVRADGAGTATIAAAATDADSGVAALVARAPRVTGWAGTPGEVLGASGAFELTWAAGAAALDVSIAARNGAGVEGAGTTVRFAPDTDVPAVTFTWPRAVLTVRPGKQTVAWTERDAGSGIVRSSRTVRQEQAAPAADGSCTAVAWGSPDELVPDGRAVGVTLRDGVCVRWTVTITDRVGHRALVKSSAVLVDGTPPVVEAPSVAIRGTSLGADGRVPLRLRWMMADADGEAVTGAARFSTDGGATWSQVALPDPTQGAVDLAVPATDALRVAVRAQDASGNRSVWQEAPVSRVRLAEDTDPSLTWTGTWSGRTVATASGGHLRWSAEPGAAVRATVHGRALAWITRTAPNGGTATVTIDGEVVATVDLARRESTDRRIVTLVRWPEAGDHTITVTVDRGHPGRVTLDAFLVLE